MKIWSDFADILQFCFNQIIHKSYKEIIGDRGFSNIRLQVYNIKCQLLHNGIDNKFGLCATKIKCTLL
jgi:hypothetical protein